MRACQQHSLAEDLPIKFLLSRVALYLRYGCFLRDLRELALKHGSLSLNFDKCGLLLPERAPAPTPEVRASFPALFDFRSDGFRICSLLNLLLTQSLLSVLKNLMQLNKLVIDLPELHTD